LIKPFALTESSQNPLVAINEFRSIHEAVMRKHEPFFPRDTVLVGLDANLGFEETAPLGRERGWWPKQLVDTAGAVGEEVVRDGGHQYFSCGMPAKTLGKTVNPWRSRSK
jgi:hypothetical protein